MRLKVLIALALSACTVLAAIAPAGARAPGTTKVIIKQESGGFSGYVQSDKPSRCANGRKVKVFKQKGQNQKPSVDTKVASDTASPNGDRYQWSIGNPGLDPGRYYARAGRISGCEPDNSRTKQLLQ